MHTSCQGSCKLGSYRSTDSCSQRILKPQFHLEHDIKCGVYAMHRAALRATTMFCSQQYIVACLVVRWTSSLN
jgi:hypothetical protein